VDDLIAEKGDEASSSHALSEKKSGKIEGNLFSAAKGCPRSSQGC
jgi:hypothetical protein